jgi:RNA polymerase sigma factor (TIGR02999 family)
MELPAGAVQTDSPASHAKALVDRVLPQIYDELRALAASLMRRERPGHTLQPTALVHEAYLRLLGQRQLDFSDRLRVLGAAARIMRRVLVDHARGRGRRKRGGGRVCLTLSEDVACTPAVDVDLLALDEALTRLRAACAQDHEIVELRFFGGLSLDEIAALLGISERTVRRRFVFARAWLFRELGRPPAAPPPPARP